MRKSLLRLKKCSISKLLAVGVGIAHAFCNMPSLQAASYNWTGVTGGAWGANTNWSGGLVPAVTDDLTVLGPSNVAGALTISIAAAASANSINFTDTAAVTLNNTTSGANQTLTLGGGGLAIGTGLVTIGSSTANQNVSIVLGASQTWNVGSGGLTLNNGISDGGSGFGITKSGAGTLKLSAASTFSGGMTLSAGALTLGNSSGLGTGSLTMNGAGATLNNSSNVSPSNGIVISGSNNIQLGSNNNLTLSGGISGSGVIALGNNTNGSSLQFSGANTMTSGTIILASNSNFVRFLSASAGNANLSWVFNNTTAGKDSLDFATNTISFGSMTGAGVIQGNANNSTQTISAGALGLNDTFSGKINNSGGTGNVLALTKVGGGTMTVSGASTYTGATTISAGVLSTNLLANGGSNSPIGASANTSDKLVVNGGTLQYTGVAVSTDRLFSTGTADAAIDASGSGAVNFTNAGSMGFSGQSGARTLTLTGANTGANTLAAVVGDNGGATSLVKSGVGQWVLAGANIYTGSTTITGGQLTLSAAGAINGSGNITLNGSTAKLVQISSVAGTTPIALTQGTLDGTGAVGAVTVGSGTGGIVTNGNGGTSALTASSLAFNGAGTLSLNIAGASMFTAPGINVSGVLITTPANGTVTVNVMPASDWALGTNTYYLLSYGSFGGSLLDFTKGSIGRLTSRETAVLGLDATNQELTLTVSADSPKWTGLDGSGWQVGSTGGNSNWQLITNQTATDYLEGDVVLFDDTASNGNVVISSANVVPSSVTFNNGGLNYNLFGSFGIAGTGGVTKSGTGTVTVSTANSYSGGTTVNNGTLALSGSATLGATSGVLAMGGGLLDLGATSQTVGAATITAAAASGNTIQNGTLNVASLTGSNDADNAIIAAQIGSGSVAMSGLGTLTLSASNSYSGGTTVNSGTLALSGVATLGASTGAVALGGGALDLGTTSQTVGAVTITAAASSGNTIQNGTLRPSSLAASNSAGNAVVAVNIAGTGFLTKVGAGAMTLSGSNAYTGATTISSGTLVLGNANAAQNSTVTVSSGNGLAFAEGIGTFNVGALSGAANLALTDTGSGAVTLCVGANNAATTYSGVLSGNGALEKVGAGTMTVTNSNSYSGGTTIRSGTLQVGSGASGSESASGLGTGLVTVNTGATLRFNPNSTTTAFNIANSFAINGGTLWGYDGNQHIGTGAGATVNIGTSGATFNALWNGKDLYLDGQLTGAGPMTFQDTNGGNGFSGGIIYATNGANTYSGTVTVQDKGYLGVANGNAFATATVNNNSNGNNSGDLTTATGVLFYTGSGEVTSASFGGLSGSGKLILQAGRAANGSAVSLSVGGNNADTAYSGPISGSGSLTKVGTGNLTLSGVNNYGGTTTVNNGTLTLNGSLSAASATTVSNGATLNGNGTINGSIVVSGALAGSLTVNGDANIHSGATAEASSFNGNIVANGTISSPVTVQTGKTLSGLGSVSGELDVAPGGTVSPSSNNTSPVGNLTVGMFNEGSGAHLALQINSTTAGDTITATTDFAVALAGDAIFTFAGSYAPAGGDVLSLIINNGGNAVIGEFSGITIVDYTGTNNYSGAEGTLVSINGQAFQLTYAATLDSTSGNDIALLAVPEPGTWAMLLSGFGFLGFWQRLRRKPF